MVQDSVVRLHQSQAQRLREWKIDYYLAAGVHGSLAAGHKILYATRWFWLRWNRILSSQPVLQLCLQLVTVHVSNVEAEVAVFCPVTSLLPSDQSFCSVSRRQKGLWPCGWHQCPWGLGYPEWDWSGRSALAVQMWVQVRVRTTSRCVDGQRGSSSVGGLEGLIRRPVLIHLDCEAVPGLWVGI